MYYASLMLCLPACFLVYQVIHLGKSVQNFERLMRSLSKTPKEIQPIEVATSSLKQTSSKVIPLPLIRCQQCLYVQAPSQEVKVSKMKDALI